MLEHLDGFGRHMRILEDLKQSSVDAYVGKIREFHAWLEENGRLMDPVALIREDVEDYLQWCFYRGNKNITRFTKLTALTKFFRYLIYKGIIDRDITERIPRPKTRKKFVQMFNKDEVLRFFKQIDITREKGIRDAVILILAAFCGLRVSEIINITLNDIVDDTKNLDVNVIGSKFDESRQVYLWKAPAMFIRQYFTLRLGHGAKSNDPLLVSYTRGGRSKGRKLTHSSVDVLIKNLAKKASIRKPEIHIHMFRATHINDLRHIKGYDLPAIAERVGHKDISTTDRYIPRRERIHRQYNSLHEYWIDFIKIWTKEEEDE